MRKLVIPCVLIMLLALTIFNYVHFRSGRLGTTQNVADFIKKSLGIPFFGISDLNIIFFLSPLDCTSCSKQLLTTNFIQELQDVISHKNSSISISYVVTGDYAESEMNNYTATIKGLVPIYIDKYNKTKEFLQNEFDTMRTPLMLIFTEKGIVKYWQTFEPDPKYAYEQAYNNLIMLLEMMI
jgi:hypothetical protein